MNKIKTTSLRDRVQAAVRAFRGKPTRSITFGVEIKRCDDCRRSGYDEAGCFFCEDAGVHRVAPFGQVDGLGILEAKYCFHCGKRLFFKSDDWRTDQR